MHSQFRNFNRYGLTRGLGMVVGALGVLTGCTGHNTLAEPVAPTSQALSLTVLNREIQLDRLRLCANAWSQYERECKRKLTLYRGLPEVTFCRSFASRRWPEQVLPFCDRQAR